MEQENYGLNYFYEGEYIDFFQQDDLLNSYDENGFSVQQQQAQVSPTMTDSLNSNTSFISYQIPVQFNAEQMTSQQIQFDNTQFTKQKDLIEDEKKKIHGTQSGMKMVDFKFESISNTLLENDTVIMHGEIPIQQIDIFNSIQDQEFMKNDVLSYNKKVNCITQTNTFLHIDLSLQEQSCHEQIANILNLWQDNIMQQQQYQIEENIMNSDIQQDAPIHEKQEIINTVNFYLQSIDYQKSYFQSNENLINIFNQQINSQPRFDNINKKAFKILKKLNNNSQTKLYIYKIVRKTPFEYSTLSRGISNSFFDTLGLDKQEISQYIMRSNNLPFSSQTYFYQRIKESISEILQHNNQYNQNKSFYKSFQSGDLSVNALINQQIFPLNEQLGDENIDINDYLIVDFIQFDQTESFHFASKMKERKLQFGYCFTIPDFHYKKMSSSIVDKYYQNYSEKQRQENQIYRLLNKRNHRFH